MKEHQISFSAPMVRAILEGRKTQTRRVLKPQPRDDQIMPRYWSDIMKYEPHTIYDGDGLGWWAIDADGNDHEFRCPYRQPGDRLLVLEEYRELDYGDVGYYADGSEVLRMQDQIELPDAAKLEPSISMLRRISRITLEITEVRVEKLQDISEDDARAEGFVEDHLGKKGFMELWESIYGAGEWDKNPLVWVITFRKVIT